MNKKPLILTALLIVSAALSNNALAQKCKFDKDETDAFTKEHVRSVKQQIGGFFFHWWMLIEQKGEKYALTLQVSSQGKVDDIIPKGTKMLLKLENGKIVEVVTDADYVPSFHVESNVIVTNWLPKGPVSVADMKAMSESPLTNIRINFAGKDIDSPEITSKEGKKTQHFAECLLSKD